MKDEITRSGKSSYAKYEEALMDAGKLLKAKVSKVTRKGSFTQIGVGIFLVDL